MVLATGQVSSEPQQIDGLAVTELQAVLRAQFPQAAVVDYRSKGSGVQDLEQLAGLELSRVRAWIIRHYLPSRRAIVLFHVVGKPRCVTNEIDGSVAVHWRSLGQVFLDHLGSYTLVGTERQ
jgi:hypothetical protein